MKFLLDVNVSRATANWLTALGHETACVGDVDCRMADDHILAWAVRERRVIVTTDLDFEEMIWRERRPHCGVLRLENLPRAARQQSLTTILAAYGKDLADGAIVIAARRHIRVRRPEND